LYALTHLILFATNYGLSSSIVDSAWSDQYLVTVDYCIDSLRDRDDFLLMELELVLEFIICLAFAGRLELSRHYSLFISVLTKLPEKFVLTGRHVGFPRLARPTGVDCDYYELHLCFIAILAMQIFANQVKNLFVFMKFCGGEGDEFHLFRKNVK